MNFCRICRTEQQQNLKYAPEQLIKIREKNYSRAKNEIMDENACTLGNICYNCEERLLSFSKLGDSLDLDEDSGRGETPLIVDDDDELLYNFFFEKMKLHQQLQQQEQQQSEQQQSEQQQQLQLLDTNRASSETDVEITELLASALQNKDRPAKQEEQYKIIDFIDLADETSCSGVSETSTKPCKVEPIKAQHTKKRKRQKYFDESKLKLLAKLNLVSSDSEADEACTSENWHLVCQVKTDDTKERNEAATAVEYHTAKKRRSIKRENEAVNVCEQIICPVCHLTYTCNQSLVHHMRSRHRDNEQETALRECERLKEDSALTIRLCYQSQVYYYECQLCGCVDVEIKTHQQHVIDKHSAELISLKDPLLQKVQCPVCQKECGGQYIDLCRHMLTEHRRHQYKLFLTEVNRSSKVPAYIKKLQLKVEQSARVFQFNAGPYLYFQCRQCGKLTSTWKSHMNHFIETHTVEVNIEEKKEIKTQTSQRSTRQLSNKTAIENKANKMRESKKTNIKSTRDVLAKATAPKAVDVKPTKNVAKVIFVKPIKAPKKLKRRRKSLEKNVIVRKLPAVLQVPPQLYKCDYCSLSCQGFFKLNLHILKAHADKEFYQCHKCAKSFLNEASFNLHEKSHEIIEEFNGRNQRRKRIGGVCLALDENSNAAKADCCTLFGNFQKRTTTD